MPSTILVVDDEPDLEHLVRQKFRRQVKTGDFKFLFAENGVQALQVLEKNGPDVDLVLTDINMPEMDGLTLLTKLRELNLMLKPVIVSAYGDMENIRTAMNRGAFDFVTKPIDLLDLETTISRTLEELAMFKDALRARDDLVALQKELSVATKIQTSILPRTFPAFPDRQEFEIFATMKTANEVGGDFYDFFSIDKYRVGFTIGDVSGKGVPAAMLMAVSRTLLKAKAMTGIPPDICLNEVNSVLVEESSSEMFVTLFYGILDTRNGRLEYCSGGHNPPFLLSADGGVKLVDAVGGLLVGAVRGVEYESRLLNLQPGETLFLYTDGVTEAVNASNEEFQEKRLETALQNQNGANVTDLVNGIMQVVQEFSQGLPQADDITMLALTYQGKK